MNILQINSHCGIGGTGRVVIDIHAILRSKGHQSTCGFGRESAINCDRNIRIGNSFDNYLHFARTLLFDLQGFCSFSATKLFIEKIKVLNPDVIHLHNLHGHYIHIELLFEYLKHAKKPVIWTLHDCWAFTGHCAYFDFIGCNLWKSACHDCPLKKQYPKSLFLDKSKSNYLNKKKIFIGIPNLTIITPSKWLSNLVKESFLQKYPVVVINNGIDLKVFKPMQSDFRERYNLTTQFIILGVAFNWGDRKGYQYFIDLAKHLKSDETIVLVGVSESQLKDLPKGIIGILKTNSSSELAQIFNVADLFLNPTLEDNFPTTNLEALACGTPVVTFNTGGSSECLDDRCGLVVERGDFNGLIKAIVTVRKNGKEFYSKKCQKRAKEFFDKDVRFAEYVSQYEESINK